MKTFVHLLAGAAATLASSATLAGSFTGNAGVTSDYMFRGVSQTGGAAVQGGVDYAFDFGMYTGLWISNSVAGGGNEADLYGGYGLKLGEFTLDGGLIYYAYTEDTETAGAANTDYTEVFVGGQLGPAALRVFYTNAFGGDQTGAVSGDPGKNELMYVTASVTLSLDDTLSFTPQIGFTSGDGAQDAFGDEYTDYSVTAVKALADDWSVSLAVVGSDRELPAGSDNKDNPKFVVGLKRYFKL